MSAPALKVTDLQTHFFTKSGVVKAVDGVSFEIAPGEIVGLVGESGSGKTVTGFSIIGLVDPPGKVVGGKIELGGVDVTHFDDRAMQDVRGTRVAMIFQDPMMTLNPVMRIDAQMTEAILAHEQVSKTSARERARDALGIVGIPSPDERLAAYPHQLSGGMRQRVAIATALLNRPQLIVADEPTTALDVTIQAQILHEVRHLAKQFGMALLWITHDLSVVASLAQRLCVMYAGRLVEQGPVDALLDHPGHPYTKGLLASVPTLGNRQYKLNAIPGMTPSVLNLPQGCAFRPRCAHASDTCLTMPELTDRTPDGLIRCHHPIQARQA